MGTPGPQKTKRYSLEFKLQAVAMSQQPGVLVQDVAESLCIHPFMLSRWRKEARDGLLVGTEHPSSANVVFIKPNEYEGLPRPELTKASCGQRHQSAMMGSVCFPSRVCSKGEVHEHCCSWC
jgi:transposase-like protein